MFFLFLLICSIFIIGGALILFGLLSKNHKELIKPGIIFLITGIGILIIPLIFSSVLEIFRYKPSMRELVGEYEIVDARNLDIDKNSYKKYKLVFNSDSTFTLTPTPFIEICKSGKYEVDYSNTDNELSFQCGHDFITGHIDVGFRDYKIEFMIGDPDSEQSIYFGKNNDPRSSYKDLNPSITN